MTDRLGVHERGALRAALVVGGLFALIAGCALGLGLDRGRYAWDAIVYHEPAIILMSRDMPFPDVSNYFSATTPGYHYLMACARALGVTSTLGLRAISALITLAWVCTLAAAVARRTGAALAVALCLPLLGSMYTLMPGVFLLPDNLGWLMVSSLLLVKLSRSESIRGIVFAGVLVTLAVLVKQVHIWTAAVVWAGAWTNAAGEIAPTRRKFKRGVLALLVTLPAFGVLAWFSHLWGGLSPPRFQGDIQGVNPALPAFLLVQIAILSPFYALPIWTDLVDAVRRHPRVILVAALIGVVLVVAPATTMDPDAGRYSGYWKLATLTPVLFGRTSSAFLVLAPIGAAALAAWGIAVPARTRVVLGVALLAFAAAHAATINAWQRYHEPMLLIVLVIAVAEVRRNHHHPIPAWRLGGPALAAVLLGAYTLVDVLGSSPVHHQPLPPNHRAPGDPQPPYSRGTIRPMDEPVVADRRTSASPDRAGTPHDPRLPVL